MSITRNIGMIVSITRNTRSRNGMTIPIHLFGDNTRMTKFHNWTELGFQLIFLKYPYL